MSLSDSKQRDSRAELLRIIAALLIIGHHAIKHGGLASSLIQSPFSVNQVWSTIIGSWGQLAVTTFIIISSWFLLDDTQIQKNGYGVKVSKALDIVWTSWFYCVLILIVVLAIGVRVPFAIIIEDLFTPFYPKGYWFVATYVVFYVTVPVLRIAASNISDKGLMYSVIIGTIFVPVYNLAFDGAIGGTLSYFYYLFFLTAYFKRTNENVLKKKCKIVFGFSSILIVSLVCLLSFASSFVGGNALLNQLWRIYNSRNIFTAIQGFSLFFIFMQMKPFTSRIINNIAKTAFGTYLITENIVLRGESGQVSILWNEIFHFSEMYETNLFIPYSAGVILLVFVCVVAIDYLRIMAVRKINFKISVFDRMDQKCLECFKNNI